MYDSRFHQEKTSGRAVAASEGRLQITGESTHCMRLLVCVRIATKVGDLLKNPESPVWVVCSESHYSVLFCPSRSIVPTSAEASTAALEATRDQLERGVEGHQTTSATCYLASSGATEDHIIGRRLEKGMPRLASGERTRGDAYVRAAGEASHQQKNDSETFDLEYYDGLGRQDEVCTPPATAVVYFSVFSCVKARLYTVRHTAIKCTYCLDMPSLLRVRLALTFFANIPAN